MTNFLLMKKSLLFIHLPKTGGTSVRKALGTDDGRYFGHVPTELTTIESFAVVRDPKSRFLSAYRMFKFGNKLDDDHYSEPRWPDLTISDALDVLEDPWVGYDRSRRQLSWNLKHHLLPQTHPFNCLAFAKRILRFETLNADFKNLSSDLDLTTELPLLRSSVRKNDDDEWDTETSNRFMRIFEADYRMLGYIPEDIDQPSVNGFQISLGPPPLEANVYSSWSAYFSNKRVFYTNAGDALPRENCQLELFVDEVIPGTAPTKTWAGRSKNLIDHFHKLQPEFSGASRLSHLLACTIVVLRRDAECNLARTLFWRILDEQFEAIRSELSLRWLVAIADTVADFGRNSGECAIGLTASVYANSAKLYETELEVFHPKRPWPPAARLRPGGKLFDGMISFWVERGDLMKNMYSRTSKVSLLEPSAGQVLSEVVERLIRGQTVYRRFSKLSGMPSKPLLDKGILNEIELILNETI